ncbi:MAG: YegS/Rv2252/BmrU family lipid kinase [Firmicutes bacterium]|nr:YegS/Rv2252/BmrU family lipid kinase [Bacillota bacterium]MBR3052775.1 YegS/Rv2252/BmrU family lipid kinase [Bacillota bacterium]
MKKTRKVILFYNPNSGNGMFKNNLDDIIARFQEADLMVVPLRASGDRIFDYLAELDKDTYQEEYAGIIAAGGDGTLNVCVNAMVENGIDLPLAVFPAGTANDFASYFEIPTNLDGMIEIALSGNTTKADVGVVNGHYFINVAAIGQVVDVSQKTDPTLKNSIGILAYYLKGLSEVPTLKPVPVTLTTPERVYREKMYFMVVMNGRSAGGFRKISPDSEINDGMLDVLLFRKIPPLEMPSFFMRVLHGTHPESKYVLHFKTSKLLLESKEDLPTDIDGEHGKKLPLDFTMLPGRLRVATREMNMGIGSKDPQKEQEE